MIVHNFDPVLIDLGFFQIRWYSLAYIFGIIIGWKYAIKIIKLSSNNNYSKIDEEQFNDLIIYIVFGIILGGRIGYVIFYNLEYYVQNFFDIFKLWKGGMSFHGGLLGVIISIFLFSNNKKIKFFKFSDIICCVSPIGIFFGRIANYINGELYGKASSIPWAVIFPYGGNIPRHPSQIYEALLEGLLLFILLNYLALKKKLLFKTGFISGLFLILYSIFRIFSEFFREPDANLGYFLNYFTMGTILSFITFVAGLFIIINIKKNEQNN
tara:strand:+ start:386 stop:1189 length:804 start_codon:yes stop_codon:yes gene_type:complete